MFMPQRGSLFLSLTRNNTLLRKVSLDHKGLDATTEHLHWNLISRSIALGIEWADKSWCLNSTASCADHLANICSRVTAGQQSADHTAIIKMTAVSRDIHVACRSSSPPDLSSSSKICILELFSDRCSH